jgi:hypothetical protein
VTNLNKIWSRPALVLFTENEPIATDLAEGQWSIGNSGTYMYLTDDNRSDLSVSVDRIEYKKRMINGTMRSYHVADKKSFNISWNNIPSRAEFVSEVSLKRSGTNLTTNWAGASEMKKWHQDHNGSFYMLLVYDYDYKETYANSVTLEKSIEYYKVFFETFTYNVTKRGGIYDLWDVSMSLVEA